MRFCFNQRFRLGLHGLERFNRCFSGKGLKFLMMRILQIKMICGGTPPEERTLDLSGSGVLSSGAFGSGAALLEALCLALYGRSILFCTSKKSSSNRFLSDIRDDNRVAVAW